MSFEEKAKDFVKAISMKCRNFYRVAFPICLTAVAHLIVIIALSILVPMITIISIFDLISEFLVKFRQEKESTASEFTESNSLKEAFKQFQADTLPDYEVLKDNERGILRDLTSDDKKRIGQTICIEDPFYNLLVRAYQEDDKVMKKLLFGHIRLHNHTSIIFLGSRKEGSVVSDVVGRIGIIPKMLDCLLIRSLAAIGLPQHVNIQRFVRHEIEIKEAFRLFKSKAIILSNSRSAMEKEVAKYLQYPIADHIAFSMESFSNRTRDMFIDKCEQITVKPEDHDKYEKINNKIVEKIAGIFRLLTNVKLGLLSDNSKEFKDTFNHEVYNLLKCARFADLQISVDAMADEEIIPSSKSIFVERLRISFSNFLGNLLKSKAISGLSKEEQADYIDILCTKVLKACIEYGSIYGSNCPMSSFLLSDSDHVCNIAAHLSNDIVKTLSLGQLTNACLDANTFEELTGLFFEGNILAGLYGPMECIVLIIESCVTKDKGEFSETDISVPIGMFGAKESQPTPLLSSTSSSQDNTHFNGPQV